MRALIFVIAIIGIYLFLRWLFKQPPRIRLQFAAVALAIVLVGLAATGRLHWIAALVGAALPFARRLLGLIGYLPLIHRIVAQFKAAKAASGPTSGQTSRVESRFLRMSLDHDTGEMYGEVIAGRFKGKRLHELRQQELIELYQQCQSEDEESAALLQAYLDRTHGAEWYTEAGINNEEAYRQKGSHSANMSRQEAYEILGLAPDAGREDIVEAHRRLIQKLHPDRGGTTYLAAKINQAKDILLNQE